MNALPDLLHANVLACNNIRPNTCTFYQFLGWKAERLPHYYRLGRRKDYQLAKPLRYILPPVQRDLGLEKVEDAADLIPLGIPGICGGGISVILTSTTMSGPRGETASCWPTW